MQYTNIHIVQDDYQKSFLQNVCQSQDCFEVYSEIFTNKKDFKKHSMLSKSFHILCITFLVSYCVYL